MTVKRENLPDAPLKQEREGMAIAFEASTQGECIEWHRRVNLAIASQIRKGHVIAFMKGDQLTIQLTKQGYDNR